MASMEYVMGMGQYKFDEIIKIGLISPKEKFEYYIGIMTFFFFFFKKKKHYANSCKGLRLMAKNSLKVFFCKITLHCRVWHARKIGDKIQFLPSQWRTYIHFSRRWGEMRFIMCFIVFYKLACAWILNIQNSKCYKQAHRAIFRIAFIILLWSCDRKRVNMLWLNFPNIPHIKTEMFPNSTHTRKTVTKIFIYLRKFMCWTFYELWHTYNSRLWNDIRNKNVS